MNVCKKFTKLRAISKKIEGKNSVGKILICIFLQHCKLPFCSDFDPPFGSTYDSLFHSRIVIKSSFSSAWKEMSAIFCGTCYHGTFNHGPYLFLTENKGSCWNKMENGMRSSLSRDISEKDEIADS